MSGDAVTHKMQLLGWEKTEKYFLQFSRCALLADVKLKLLCPVSYVLGFWLRDYPMAAALVSLDTKKNFFRRVDRSEAASPQANPTPSPQG
jgi:hypothetical protein